MRGMRKGSQGRIGGSPGRAALNVIAAVNSGKRKSESEPPALVQMYQKNSLARLVQLSTESLAEPSTHRQVPADTGPKMHSAESRTAIRLNPNQEFPPAPKLYPYPKQTCQEFAKSGSACASRNALQPETSCRTDWNDGKGDAPTASSENCLHCCHGIPVLIRSPVPFRYHGNATRESDPAMLPVQEPGAAANHPICMRCLCSGGCFGRVSWQLLAK